MDEDDGFELNTMLHEFEGDVVEEGDRGEVGPAKNVLDKRSANLSEASLRLRAEVLPAHLQRKFRTVVCRHWMRGECHKGDNCEFLHKLDESRMDNCKLGMRCPNKDNGKCTYKHQAAELTCTFYRQGFCPLGQERCKSEHIKLPLARLPVLGDWTNGIVSARPPQAGNEWFALDGELVKRRDQGPNAMYKTGLCKHYMQTGGSDPGGVGVCPFGDDCLFAHGPHDVKKHHPPTEQRLMSAPQAHAQGSQQPPGHHHHSGQQRQGSLPDGFALKAEDEPFRLFMLKSNSIRNLARSLRQKVWRVRKELIPRLNEAFYSGVKVLLLFSLSDSDQVQGCVTMLSPIPEEPALPLKEVRTARVKSQNDKKSAPKASLAGKSEDGNEEEKAEEKEEEIDGGAKKTEEEEEEKEGNSNENKQEDKDDDDDDDDEDEDEEDEDPEALFSAHFGVSWDRDEGCMRECDLSALEDLPNKLQYGVPCSLAADGQEISSAPECGGQLLRRLWASPEPTLEPEPYMEEEPLNLEEEARCAKDGGFVFATPSKSSAGECIEKQLVGCGAALELDVAFLTKGTPLFLLNKATSSLVFGLLLCNSDEPANLDPGLATTSLGLPPGSTTPCPHQVSFRSLLTCKPLRVDDPELLLLLGRPMNQPLGEGALTAPETARVVELLARRQYLAHVAAAAKLIASQMMLPNVGAAVAGPVPPSTLPDLSLGGLRVPPPQPPGLPPPPQSAAAVTGNPLMGGIIDDSNGSNVPSSLPLPAGPPPPGPPPNSSTGAPMAAGLMPPPWWRTHRPGRFFQVIVVGMDQVLPPYPSPQCPFDPARALASAGDLERVAALVGGGCNVRLRGGGGGSGGAAAAAAPVPWGPPGSSSEPLQIVVSAETEAAVARAVHELRGCLEQCWHTAKRAAGPRAVAPDAPLPCTTPSSASSAQGGSDGGPLLPSGAGGAGGPVGQSVLPPPQMAAAPSQGGDWTLEDPQAKRPRNF